MAVPKKKRYKQVVRSRRSLQQNQVFLKNKIILTKFTNYIVTKDTEIFNIPNCNFCHGKELKFAKKLCPQCYYRYFVSIYLRKLEKDNKEFRSLDFEYLHYVELSKTFFPPSGS